MEELLAHRDRVQRLARALADDGAGADDVEQEAWLVALGVTGRTIDAPRAWLSGVVRNVARNRRRARTRRDRHEALAPPREPALAVDEALARAELHDLVAAAVLGLDEPFRAAVMLRYVDDLPPRVVADRLNIPLETARSRIRRGIARVRASLDGRFGGDARHCTAALLAMAGPCAGPSPTTTKGLAMASVSKNCVALVCTLLLLLGIAITFGVVLMPTDGLAPVSEVAAGVDSGADADTGSGAERDAAVRRSRKRVTAGAQGDTPADSANVRPETGSEPPRTDVAIGERAPPVPNAPITAAPDDRSTVRVTTSDGKPIAGAKVTIERAPTVEWPRDYAAVLSTMLYDTPVISHGITDEDGNVRLPELVGNGAVRVRVSKSGHGTSTRRHFPRSSGVAVELRDAHAVRGMIDVGDAAPPTGLIVMLAQGAGPPTLTARATVDINGRFAIPSVAAGRYTAWVAWPGGLPAPLKTIDVPTDGEVRIQFADGGTLAGIVRHAATGDPVTGVRVLALGEHGYVGQTTSDDSGRYVLRLIGAGKIKRLTAWKHGMVEVALRGEPFTVGAGVERVADLEIYHGGTVTGVVRGPDGPIAGASVQVWTADGGYITQAATQTDDGGSYRLTGVRPGLAHVLVSPTLGLVHAGEPGMTDRWRALLEKDLDPRCSVTVVDGGSARLDVTLEPATKKATAAR